MSNSKKHLQPERCPGILHLGCRRLVYEPIDLSRCNRPHPRRRKPLLGLIQYRSERIRLIRTASHERDPTGMVDNWIRQRNPLRWGFGAIGDISDPSVFLREQLVAGEQRRSVSVGSHSEEDDIEDGEAGGVLLGELVDELFLIGVGELFDVGGEGVIDGVDVLGGDGDFAEELGDAETVVGVFVVEGDDSFVCVVYLPV